MSTENLQFQFTLIDKITGPANVAVQSLVKVQQTLNQLNNITIKVGGSFENASGGLESWVTKLNSAIGVGKTFVGVLENVATGVAGVTRSFVGAVIDAAGFHARMMTTLGVMLRGEQGGARREFSAGLRLGRVLPGTTEDTLVARQQLVTAGFKDRGERDRMFALQQDLVAQSTHAPGVATELATRFIGDVRQRGYLAGEEMRQLMHLNAGIGRGEYFAEIARGRGLRGNETSQMAQVQSLVENRAIPWQEALAALQRVDVKNTGLDLGGFAHKQGTGLVGQLSTAQETPRNILLEWFNRQDEAMKSGGMSAFGNALAKFNQFFEAGTPSAERLMRVLDKLINGVFGSLFGNDPTPILTHLLDLFEQSVPVFINVLDTFKGIGSALAIFVPLFSPLIDAFGHTDEIYGFKDGLELLVQIFGAIGTIFAWLVAGLVLGIPTMIGWLVKFGAQLGEWATQLTTWFMDMGPKLIDGLVNGIGNGAHRVWEAIKALGRGAVNVFKDMLAIHSPSGVMMGLGGYIGEGLALGIERSQPRVAGAFSALAPNAMSLSDFGSTSGHSSHVAPGAIQVTLNFNLPEHATDAHSIAEAARPMVETALAEVLERMAMSAGVQ